MFGQPGLQEFKGGQDLWHRVVREGCLEEEGGEEERKPVPASLGGGEAVVCCVGDSGMLDPGGLPFGL